MTIITIKGESPETRSYSPTTFYLCRDALWSTADHPHGREVVISESPVTGSMLREDMTREKVLCHAMKMKQMGFSVTKTEVGPDGIHS